MDRDRIETAPTRRPPVVAAIRVDETPPAPEFHPTARHEPVADRRPPLEVIEERDVEAERPVVTPSPRQPAVGTQAAGPERVPRLDNERRPPAEPVRSFERPIPAATRFETDAETFQALEIARPEPRTVLRASLPERLRDRDEPDTPTRPESSRQVARGVASASPPRSTRSEASDAPADPPSPIETTVHVSIGRIEVRAVAPPSSTPKARPVSVAKSLNDYLHERARGAGR